MRDNTVPTCPTVFSVTHPNNTCVGRRELWVEYVVQKASKIRFRYVRLVFSDHRASNVTFPLIFWTLKTLLKSCLLI